MRQLLPFAVFLLVSGGLVTPLHAAPGSSGARPDASGSSGARPDAGPAKAEQTAPEAEPRKQAEIVFRRAVKLFGDQRWDAALVEFRSSLQLYPTRAATVDVAICLEKLGRYEEAVTTLERGLVETTTWTADDRAEITKKLNELSLLLGTVTVATSVEGAEVLIDSVERGTTPLATALRVGAGSHRIRVEKANYLPYERSFDVAGGQALTFDATLTALSVAPAVPAAVVPAPPAVPAAVVPAPASHGSSRAPYAYASLGVGALALGTGLTAFGLRNGTISDMQSMGCSGKIPAGPLADQCVSRNATQRTERTVGLVAYGASAVFLGVGAALLLLPSSSKAHETSALRCGVAGVGLHCAGEF